MAEDLGQELRQAAFAGDIARLSSLLSSGAVSVDAPDVVGRTALHYAATEGQAEAVEALVRAGGSVNAANHWGSCPLHSAALRGHVPVIKALVQAGAAVDTFTRHGHTPLHRAAEQGHAPAVAALVEAGASVDAAASPTRETPLHLAAEWGHGSVVQALLSAGADVRRRLGGRWGDTGTARELAQRHGHVLAASLLQRAEEQQPVGRRRSWWPMRVKAAAVAAAQTAAQAAAQVVAQARVG